MRCEKVSLESEGCTFLYLLTEQGGFAIEAKISLAPDEAVEITRLRLVDLEQRPRKITLATLREWVLNETGVEQRDAAYNAIHIGTWFVGGLNAIIAQNRLLKGGARRDVDRRLSPEVGFHAIGAGDGTRLRVVGYEDVKARFYGLGAAGAPDSLRNGDQPRDPSDEGLLFGFEPIASLRAELEISAGGAAEIVIVDGWARDIAAATRTIAKHLSRDFDFASVETALARKRALIQPPVPAEHRYAFRNGRPQPDARPGHAAPLCPCDRQCVRAGRGARATTAIFFPSPATRGRIADALPHGRGPRGAGGAGDLRARYVARQDTDCATFVPLRRATAKMTVDIRARPCRLSPRAATTSNSR